MGFTLIELLGVITVIAILAGLVAPMVFSHVGDAKASATRAQMWGRPYVYKSPGDVNAQGYDLLTYGRDGQPGGTGEDADITSWESARRR